MKKENRNRHEAGKFEIRAIEARILSLRGKYREEAMAAYRKLLGVQERNLCILRDISTVLTRGEIIGCLDKA